ncbi:MAG: hypothetical protein A2174_03545 [Candidatus Portnoybacteria bacterium RBG_13_41_18]|uniref:Heat-inducible transcription repressor HrcA C-terminal domain-containing protein n=1 Tax=Candidatus Portnoybacteria bacterium RBG_13_41_18 TaxID=1801991 RepID=A0A1G2F8P0_9BACT|nr:MAG: hypothetical protein A2174_03545 [Candidatus Portnoybacteria bacterium RBG_13_41_18]
MNSRQKNILGAIMKEYQKTGQPVASGVLVENYEFDLSPATIRAEMLALDDQGLLEQPHHSAGRVPTTKAYRLFVNEILNAQNLEINDGKRIRKNLAQIDREKLFSRDMAQILADFSHNLGLSGFFGEDSDFHEAGLSSLFESIEDEEPKIFMEILRGFDTLEKRFDYVFDELEEEVKVFIGEENPIDDFKKLSLVISGYEFDGQKGFLGILGPKRMNYARNIFLVEETKKVLKENK